MTIINIILLYSVRGYLLYYNYLPRSKIFVHTNIFIYIYNTIYNRYRLHQTRTPIQGIKRCKFFFLTVAGHDNAYNNMYIYIDIRIIYTQFN